MITRQKHNLVLPIVNNSYFPPFKDGDTLYEEGWLSGWKKPHQSIVQTFVGNVEVGCDCLTSLNGWYGVLNLILPQVHFIESNNQNDLSDKSKSSGPIWSRYNYCQLKEECEDRKSVYLVGYQILTFNVRNSHNSNYGNFTNQHLSSVLLIRVNIVISQIHSYSILGI